MTPHGSRLRAWSVAVAAVLVVGLIALFRDALDGGASTSSATVEPIPAPDLSGEAIDGTQVDLAELRGNVVVVNVWASWCAPCRDELPLLAATVRRHRSAGLRLVGINSQDDTTAARGFLADIDAEDTTHVVDPDGRLAVAWGAPGIPTTFVVDREGRIVARTSGEVTSAWLGETVLPLLAG